MTGWLQGMFFLLFVLLASGCLPSYRVASPLHDLALQEGMDAKLKKTWPAWFEATHRVVLRSGSTEVVMTGLLSRSSLGEILLVAMGDFGKTVFVLRGKPGESIVVDNTIGGLLTPKRLRQTAWVDALLCFFLVSSPPSGLEEGEDGTKRLVFPWAEGFLALDLDGIGRPVKGMQVVDGGIVRALTWRYKNQESRYPAGVELINHELYYSLTIEITEVEEIHGGR